MSSPNRDHRNPDLAPEHRADLLLGEMNLREIWVGFSADDHPLHATVDLVGPPRTLASSERSFLSEAVVMDA